MHSTTILVLEDERPLAAAIKQKLENSGLEAVTARSVQQGLEYLRDIPQIKAVWLDHYLLGQEDGLDFVVQLKSETSPWKHLPILVVSNSASADKVQAYLQLGVDQYLAKTDYSLASIIEQLTHLLREEKR